MHHSSGSQKSKIKMPAVSIFSLKALGDDSPLPLPSFSWLLAILGIPWFVSIDASLQYLPLSSHGLLSVCLYIIFPLGMCISVSSHDILTPLCVCIHISSSYKDTSYWIRAHLSLGWTHLNLITSVKTQFPNMVTFTDAGISTYFEGGYNQTITI